MSTRRFPFLFHTNKIENSFYDVLWKSLLQDFLLLNGFWRNFSRTWMKHSTMAIFFFFFLFVKKKRSGSRGDHWQRFRVSCQWKSNWANISSSSWILGLKNISWSVFVCEKNKKLIYETGNYLPFSL